MDDLPVPVTAGDGVLELIEIVLGIDLEKDVLAHMASPLRIASPLKRMDSRLFRPEPMNLEAHVNSKERARAALRVAV